MSRLENLISNLSAGKLELENLISNLQKDQNLRIIYDVFVEHQKDFEDKIESPQQLKNLIKESIDYSIKKLYDIKINDTRTDNVPQEYVYFFKTYTIKNIHIRENGDEFDFDVMVSLQSTTYKKVEIEVEIKEFLKEYKAVK